MERHDLDVQVNEELLAANKQLRAELERVRSECDALAAHLEAGKCLLKVGGYAKWCQTAPATSLARRDALKKAEALETFAKHCRQLSDNARENGYMQAADAVDDMADEAVQEADRLRQQAEGEDQ